MKKLLLTLLCLGCLVSTASAMKYDSDTEVLLDRSRFISDDWYVAGEQVNVFGSALQDVWVAASRAQLWGMVGQDLNLLAVEADIRGRIGDDLRIVAGDMILSPTVEGSALLVGRRIQIQRNTIFNSDLLAAGREITVEGNIQGPVKIYGETVLVNAVIAGEVHIRAENVSVGPEAKVMGRVTVISSKPADVDPKAYLSTPIVWRKPAGPEAAGQEVGSWFSAGQWYTRMTIFIGLMAFGLLMVLMLPGISRRYALTIRHRVWPSLGWGVFTLVALPLLALIFLVTVIGIPIAIVLGLFYLLMMFAARLGVGYLIGLAILKPAPADTGRNALSLLLGFSLLTLLGWVPLLGGLVNFVSILLGLGAIWLTKGFVEPVPQAIPAPEAVPAAILPAAEVAAVPKAAAVKSAANERKHTPAQGAAWQPEVPAFMKNSQAAAVKKTAKKAVAKKTVTKKTAVKRTTARKSTTKEK